MGDGASPILNPDGSWGMTAEQFAELLKEMREMSDQDNRREQSALGLLMDLDRCPHGRHVGDACIGCPDEVSAGNPHLSAGTVIGYNISGRPYVMPARDRKHDLQAWLG